MRIKDSGASDATVFPATASEAPFCLFFRFAHLEYEGQLVGDYDKRQSEEEIIEICEDEEESE